MLLVPQVAAAVESLFIETVGAEVGQLGDGGLCFHGHRSSGCEGWE